MEITSLAERLRQPRTAAGLGMLMVAILLGTAFVLFLVTPIVAFDTDLFYHLAHGRTIATTGELPTSTDFSFLEPTRVIVDYFWLFQRTIYEVHQRTGFHGLIVVRGVLFLLTMLVVVDALMPRRASARQWLALPVVLVPILVLVAIRDLNLRPHVFSYLLICAFLAIFLKRRRWLVILPVLAVAWVNFHGITYPVLLLVCGAIFVDQVAQRIGQEATDATVATSQRTLLVVFLCCAAVLLTPHGRELLRVPFVSTKFANLYISELGPTNWSSFLTFDLSRGVLAPPNAYLVLAVVAAWGGWRSRHELVRQPGALLLALGGLALVSRGMRFLIEGAILLIPLLRMAIAELPAVRVRVLAGVAVVVTLLGMSTVVAVTPSREWAYPLASHNLPQAAVAFLAQDPVGGSVLNDPNSGGYLLWALPPRFSIAMDMEVPFMFLDADMYHVAGARRDAALLATLISRYRPPYILAPTSYSGMAENLTLHGPSYKAVFFDSVSVVYADLEQRPHLQPLELVDPYAFSGPTAPKLEPAELEPALAELDAILEVSVLNDQVALSSAVLLNRLQRYEEALARVEIARAAAPRSASVHIVRAHALAGLGRADEAIQAFRDALDRAPSGQAYNETLRSLGAALGLAGDHQGAYEALSEAYGLFNESSSVADLESLGNLAVAVGELDVGRTLLEFALLKLPYEDPAYQRVSARLEELAAATGSAP